jgi:SnoaL-like domain
MTVHTELSPTEAADRLALRELFDAYAHCADRRDAEGQKALFTDDTRFAVYMDGEVGEPTYVLQGREALTPAFDDLNRYEVTTHFNGQSMVDIDGNRATGESCTLAHHVFTENSDRKIMIASLRYLDTFAKIDGRWTGSSPNGSSSSIGARRDHSAPKRRADGTALQRPGPGCPASRPRGSILGGGR